MINFNELSRGICSGYVYNFQQVVFLRLSMMQNISRNRRDIFVILALLFFTFAVYSQGFNHDFVNFDDPKYVIENPDVRSGLSLKGTVWAFTTTHASNWHPLTWLSHMLDIELFGLSAGWHHMTSLLFHIFNTLLLFFVLQRMTKAFYRSLFVAALFALHPLHVESVAWIAERKDVLSTFFWMLVMYSYVLYVERPLWSRYCFILLFFILGLLSKPMLVTLPFVLLLLDFWPLKRFKLAERTSSKDGDSDKTLPLSRLIVEKIPLFVIVILFSTVTFFAQQKGGAVVSLAKSPFNLRLENSFVSYIRYIIKMFWPFNLSVFYPPSARTLSIWLAGGAVFLLLVITIFVLRKIKSHPYLSVGWFWYVGTLVPVIGLVQVGAQSMADRYTYIPIIGLFILLAWGIADALKKWKYSKAVLSFSGGIILITLTICSWVQTGYWKNSITLFEHAINVTSHNYMAHYNLGIALSDQERYGEALSHLQETIKIRPYHYQAHKNLGIILGQRGNLKESVYHLEKAIRIKPDYADAHVNLGVALNRLGRSEEAVEHYYKALTMEPDDANTHFNLGVALARIGSLDNAVFHFKEALAINPDDIDARDNLDTLLKIMEEGSRYSR